MPMKLDQNGYNSVFRDFAKFAQEVLDAAKASREAGDAQLLEADRINNDRLATWHAYDEAFRPLEKEGRIVLPTIPDGCVHNAHMYYVKLRDLAERTAFINHLHSHDVGCVFHYVPLHSAPAGRRFGRFHGEDVYTTSESDRLARLPLYYGMTEEDRDKVIRTVLSFFD